MGSDSESPPRLPARSSPARAAPRRVEVLAALSLAIDLGLGQPMEHMLRSAVIGVRLADAFGLDRDTRQRIFYTNLLAWIGCHADSFELAALFGDDIGFRRDYSAIDARGLPLAALLLRRTGSDLGLAQRALARSRFLAMGRAVMRTTIQSHCASAAQLGGRVGLDDALAPALDCTFERWDGHGLPDGRAGAQIPLETRIAHVADVADVALRDGGTANALAVLRARSGTQLDPDAVALFRERADAICGDLSTSDPWPLALAESHDPAVLAGAELDDVLVAIGDFADLKSPWFAGHSRAVASLAADAAEASGLAEADTLRRAGWVHDVGRLGVSNRIWDKSGDLTHLERERVDAHPYLAERIISRIPGLHREAQLAAAHHERVDGSGYPRGLTSAQLDAGQRLLAAADDYSTSTETRPHRPALSARDARARLRSRAREGALDPGAVDAVLAAAGDRTPRRTLPSGLTPREAEVLALVCRGLSNRQIADELVIAPKTARNHVEHIYAKIDAHNRVGATLFAMEHGLAAGAAAASAPAIAEDGSSAP